MDPGGSWRAVLHAARVCHLHVRRKTESTFECLIVRLLLIRTLEWPGGADCDLSKRTLTAPVCRWGTQTAQAPLHYCASCQCQRPPPPISLSMGVVEALEPMTSPCSSPGSAAYRLPHSSSYSSLQGKKVAELELEVTEGLEGGGQAAEHRSPLMDLFCETCTKPWLIGWWDQVGIVCKIIPSLFGLKLSACWSKVVT